MERGTDDSPDRPRSMLAVWLIVGLVLLPALYVLSLGPASWLLQHGYLNNAAIVFYEPLRLLHDNCKPIGDELEWYVDLWGG